MGAPAQRVDHPDAGQPERQADHPVLAGAAAGADGGQPGHRGRREPGLQCPPAQRRHHRGIVGVGVEEFRTETVDQEHARAADLRGQIDPAVETGHTHRRQHRWHHVGQMGSVRVRLWQVHIASLPYCFRYAAADDTVAGIGLMLLLAACAPSNPTAAPTQAAGSRPLAAPAAQQSPGPDDETFSIGPAATDTIGGYLPDGQNHLAVRCDQPRDRMAGPAVARGDPEGGPRRRRPTASTCRSRRAGGPRVSSSGCSTMQCERTEMSTPHSSSSPHPMHHSTCVGKAVDVGPVEADNWLIRNGSRFGLCQIYANEIWHFELAADKNGNCPPLLPNAAG